MITILEACVLFHGVVGGDVIGSVEHKEDCSAVIDAQFEPPVGHFCFSHVAELVVVVLMLGQVVDCVVDVAELVDHVVGDLVEVAEGIHVEVTSCAEFKNTGVEDDLGLIFQENITQISVKKLFEVNSKSTQKKKLYITTTKS